MNPTIEQILNMIRLGEDSGVEFKEVRFRGDRVSDPGKNQLAKEIAAKLPNQDEAEYEDLGAV